MRAFKVFLTIASAALLGTFVTAEQAPGGQSSPRPPTRDGYRDIFPEWLLDDIFGNYEVCIGRIAVRLIPFGLWVFVCSNRFRGLFRISVGY